ncbi:MAG: TrmH family RNA methyltransferase [Pseudobdellovibrionaceae bacterium]
MFPFQEKFTIDQQYQASYQEVLKHIWPLLTDERRKKIERVVEGRCFSNVVVMECIYDRGNISAVMRTAEAMGLAQIHLIEQQGEKFRESQRTTAGADKWVEVQKWKATKDCIQTLKAQGKQIIVTHLDATSKPIAEIDFSKPSALVLGNEKDGVSKEMIEAADHRVIIPMEGFVQSYNISVAGALCFYQMYQSHLTKTGRAGDLTDIEKDILKAVYAARTLDSTKQVLEALASRT